MWSKNQQGCDGHSFLRVSSSRRETGGEEAQVGIWSEFSSMFFL